MIHYTNTINPVNFPKPDKKVTNERIKKLAGRVDWSTDTSYDELTKFAELIYKDIITVVAAQALCNESALDVFKNLKRLYEGVEE